MNNIIKSYLGGIVVAIGATSILLIDNVYIRSITFSIGLLFVSILGLNMFTGKCGEFVKNFNILYLFKILIFNLLGLYSINFILKITRLKSILTLNATEIEIVNQNDSLISIFILATLCGLCLSLAVEAYKSKNLFAMVLIIFVFSICSYQHSLAHSYFMFIKGFKDVNDVYIILIQILGNFVGSNVFTLLYKNKWLLEDNNV